MSMHQSYLLFFHQGGVFLSISYLNRNLNSQNLSSETKYARSIVFLEVVA